AVGAVFVRRQRQRAEPMIDLRLFQIPMFSAALVVNIIAIFAAFGSFLSVTQYLQLVLGMSPLAAGMWLAPTGIVIIVGAVLAPIIVRRFAARTVLTGGFLVTAIGYTVLAQVGVESGLEVVLTGLMLFCVGLAPMGTLTTDLVMSAAPPEKAGAASGVS